MYYLPVVQHNSNNNNNNNDNNNNDDDDVSACLHVCIGGSVVESSPVTQEARIRFLADARHI